MEMRSARDVVLWWWMAALIGGFVAATADAQTVDGVAVDAEAELVVAGPDDTNNMDPRIGMGSTRPAYIPPVFESPLDVDAQGKPPPPLAPGRKPPGHPPR